jgi:DNA-binding beta-propeller fold protein YncE
MRSSSSVFALLVLPFISFACANAGDDGDVSSASTAARDVLLVGNSVAGTVSFLDAHTYKNLGSVNVVPDLAQREAAIKADLIHAIAYALIADKEKIHHFEPSNGKRFVDDVFVSPDGTRLYVSRSNLGDVAAFDLTQDSHPILWRHDVSGFKADHATLSPDGARLVVSCTAVDKSEVLDSATGNLIGTFPTGHYPHQNDFSADGKHIYNGSIGDVSISPLLDFLKGPRVLTVVDAASLQVVRTYMFTAGIRPTVITADEKTMFAQLSYLNGLVKFDLDAGKIVSTVQEPYSDFAKSTYPTREDYPHDSAHHGLALSTDGTKLCDVGTIDNNVTIVDATTMTAGTPVDVGLVPYWATTSPDGKSCLVSVSGDGVVAVVDYATGKLVTKVPVGQFPQRNRLGQVPANVITHLSPSAG